MFITIYCMTPREEQLTSSISDSSTTRTSPGLTSFDSNGFSLGDLLDSNKSGDRYVAWNFAAAPGFFDVVTYDGNGSPQAVHTPSKSVPGFIITKGIDYADNWHCVP